MSDVRTSDPRPEVGLTFPRTDRARRDRAAGRLIPPYHATNIEHPWETACGLTIDAASVAPLGIGMFTCQHRACAKVLLAAPHRGR